MDPEKIIHIACMAVCCIPTHKIPTVNFGCNVNLSYKNFQSYTFVGTKFYMLLNETTAHLLQWQWPFAD